MIPLQIGVDIKCEGERKHVVKKFHGKERFELGSKQMSTIWKGEHWGR